MSPNDQRIEIIERAQWITSPDDGVLSKGMWRLHTRTPAGGQTTIYGESLLEVLDNAVGMFYPTEVSTIT